MAKSLLYRIFGLGSIPAAQHLELQSEGELLCEEGLRFSTAEAKRIMEIIERRPG